MARDSSVSSRKRSFVDWVHGLRKFSMEGSQLSVMTGSINITVSGVATSPPLTCMRGRRGPRCEYDGHECDSWPTSAPILRSSSMFLLVIVKVVFRLPQDMYGKGFQYFIEEKVVPLVGMDTWPTRVSAWKGHR